MFADFCEMLQSSGICGCGFFRSPGSLHEVFLLADRNKKKNEIFSQGFGLRFSPSSVAPPPPPAESEKQPTLTPHRFPPPAPNKLNPRPVSPPRPERKNRRSPWGTPHLRQVRGVRWFSRPELARGGGRVRGRAFPAGTAWGPPRAEQEERTRRTSREARPRLPSPPPPFWVPEKAWRERNWSRQELEQAPNTQVQI